MEKYSFFNGEFDKVTGTYDRQYLAQDYARYFASFIGNGVYGDSAKNLQICEKENMTVIVEVGKGWINGYFYDNNSQKDLKLLVADGGLDRIDRIVLRLDLINRLMETTVKTGTKANIPNPPALRRDSHIYELALADIKVGKGVSEITEADITDLRMNAELCGIVTGVIDQIDTDEFFKQYESLLDRFLSTKTTEFNDWFNNLRDKLEGDTLGNLQSQIDDINTALEVTNALDAIVGEIDANEVEESGKYLINGDDIKKNFPTGVNASGYLEVINHTDNFIKQIFHSFCAQEGIVKLEEGANGMWVRTKTNGEWVDWSMVAMDGETTIRLPQGTVRNADKILKGGTYWISANEGELLNFPFGESEGFLEVLKGEDIFTKQTFLRGYNDEDEDFNANKNAMFVRTYSPDFKWSEWSRVQLEEYDNTYSKLNSTTITDAIDEIVEGINKRKLVHEKEIKGGGRLVRIGNTVQYTFEKTYSGFTTDKLQLIETIPYGYCPINETTNPVTPLVGHKISGNACVKVHPSGNLYMISDVAESRTYAGTMTWLTKDKI